MKINISGLTLMVNDKFLKILEIVSFDFFIIRGDKENYTIFSNKPTNENGIKTFRPLNEGIEVFGVFECNKKTLKIFADRKNASTFSECVAEPNNIFMTLEASNGKLFFNRNIQYIK